MSAKIYRKKPSRYNCCYTIKLLYNLKKIKHGHILDYTEGDVQTGLYISIEKDSTVVKFYYESHWPFSRLNINKYSRFDFLKMCMYTPLAPVQK